MSVPISGDSVEISATVSDGIGQVAELSKTVTVDGVGPTVSITRDQNVRPGVVSHRLARLLLRLLITWA